ncbi:MAG: hypothetical protein IH585_19680, partial [Anaerolineaceae bacterium]|nr:hypothetical protein [Anaerolineaceae bacterium]
MSSDNILYRRQFILGDHPILDFPEWKSIPFGPLHLTVHPDLDTTFVKGTVGEFLLLGFALNHYRPEATNKELMEEMAETCHGFDELLEYSRDLCGRYIIVYNIPGEIGLLNDLIGSRSVYYYIHQEAIWCASQPSMLAVLLGIDEDRSPEVMEYVEKDMFASGEGCWIGDGTKFIGIKHLLPNHYLDLISKKSVRYWPTCPVGNLDLESASRKSAEILENTIQSATNRFEMSMAVTSGWDSRCMLAATRKISSKVYYYIQKYGEMTENHPDVTIPKKLANKLGFPFHTIKCEDYQDDAFDAMLKRNVFLIHNPEKKVLYRNFFQNFQGKVNASGNISDLGRAIYGIDPVDDITDLLRLVNLNGSVYAEDSLKDWYAEAKLCCETLGFNLRDLFFWEQVLGNWGSMFAAELDIAIDEFYPFGTRRLVETILAVDERLRPCSNSKVHRRIIELLWPELLSEPINPISWRKR